MAQPYRQRHKVFRLAAGIAEHYALVAGPLVFFILAIHSAVDVVTLFVKGGKDAAAAGVELVLGLGVADAVDDVSRCLLDVNISFRADFSADYHKACGDECLAGNLAVRVLDQELVEYSV